MQGQALFNDGQANSMAKIVATQLATSGGNATFNQPDINSVNGFNPISSNLDIGLVLRRIRLLIRMELGQGRQHLLQLEFPGSSVTCPKDVTTPPIPAPYNTADLQEHIQELKLN